MKYFNYFAALLVLCACLGEPSQAEELPAVGNYLHDFEAYLQETVTDEVPGAALVVVDNGKVSLLKTYGVKKLGQPAPISPETVFRLASVSKTMAATAAAILVRDYQVSWNTPLASVLDSLQFKNPTYGQQISLKNIMSHSTGLIPHAYTNLVEHGVPFKKILGKLSGVDFVCAPGECYGYQNVVFSLVGDVVKAKSGMAYEDYVTNKLFRPLGMENASIGLKPFTKNRNHATPHIKLKKRWRPVKKISPNYYNIAPAAGVNASIKDMSEWLLAQMGHNQNVLPNELLDQLQTPVIKTTKSQSHYGQRAEVAGSYYGLGWRIFDFGDYHGFVHHGGWVQGMRSEVVFNRELQIGMVFLTNSESRFASDVIFKFLELYSNSNPRQTENNAK